ncbi:MAG: hypothetical protein SFZ02_19130 [bacterium]|nr:hypothetical protein [bacterium]
MGIKIYIDWDKNDNFTDTYDDITADVMSVRWTIGARSAYQSVADESTCEIVVRNVDKKYTPENTTSPIYGKILPNRRIRIMDDKGSGTQLWNGYLEAPKMAWQPMGPALTGRHNITLQGYGAKQRLQKIEVRLGLYEDTTIDVIITDALREAGIFLPLQRGWFLGVAGKSELGVSTYLIGPAGWSEFEVGISNIATYGNEVKNVLAIIEELVRTERGRFGELRDGKFFLHNRHHIYQATDNGTISESDCVGINYASGDDVYNVINVKANPRKVQASETLWELDAPITVGVGDTAELEATLRRDGGQFAGAGSLTPTYSFSVGSGTVDVVARGGKAVVTVANTGNIPAVLATLSLAGAPTYNQNSMRVTKEDSLSVASLGRQELNIDAGVTSDYSDALAIAETELARRVSRGIVKSVQMKNMWDGIRNAYMFADNQIGYFVTVDAPSINHNARYIIIGESHSWQAGGEHNTEFFLEPLSLTPAFRWDVSNWDESYWIF